MRIYLAGPMSGIPNYNFPAFWRAARELRKRGFMVISPAEEDVYDRRVAVRDPEGMSWWHVTGNPVDIGYQSDELEKFTVTWDGVLADMMRHDLPIVCEVDGVVFLPGWPVSRGCARELAVALWTGRRTGLYAPDAPEGVQWREDMRPDPKLLEVE